MLSLLIRKVCGHVSRDMYVMQVMLSTDFITVTADLQYSTLHYSTLLSFHLFFSLSHSLLISLSLSFILILSLSLFLSLFHSHSHSCSLLLI